MCDELIAFQLLISPLLSVSLCFFLKEKKTKMQENIFLYTWVRASWMEFNNCPTRCDLFSYRNI